MSTRIPKENFFRAWLRISLMFTNGLLYAVCAFVVSWCAVPVIPLVMTYLTMKDGNNGGFFKRLWRSIVLFPVVCLGALLSPFVNLWSNLRYFYPIALHEWRMRDVISENPYMVAWMRKRLREDEAIRRRQAERMASAESHPHEENNVEPGN